jgi:O-antigen/teichoic acid export membrane protein
MDFFMAFRLPSLSPVAWLTAEKITQHVLWLVLFTILAPILGPRPYGVFSIVMVFVGFCEFILGEVAVEALVTVDELDAPHMATANMATAALAATVSVALCLLAPAIAIAFHEEELKWLLWALAPLPALSLLSAVPIAVLRRSLQYKRLAVRSILGLVIGGLVGIALGVAGAGVWALALQVLVQRLAEVAIVWASVPHRFRLGWSNEHFREMQSVGVNVFMARAMIFAGGQFPRLILGYVLGPSELGLFTLAGRFVDIVTSTALFPRVSVGRVELRKFALGSKEFQQRFADMGRDAAMVTFPILFGTAAIMPELLRIWLDPRWAAGTVAAQVLLLGGLPLVISYSVDAALLAAKLSSVLRTLTTLQAVTVVLTVAVAAPFGLTATSVALAVRSAVILAIYVGVYARRCDMRTADVMRPFLFPLLGGIIMTIILYLPARRVISLNDSLTLLAMVTVGAVVYGGFLYSFWRAQFTAALASFFAHGLGQDST